MFLQRHTIFLVAAAQASNAQSLDETIVGCGEVGCPTASDSTAAECQVADKDFSMIGLARVPTDTDTLEGLSWVEDLDLNGTIACALFFTRVNDRVSFGDDSDDESISQGTCEEALSEKCVSALISRAEDLDFDGLGSAEVCKKLQEEFEDNLDSECDSFADGSKWVGLNSTVLSGSGGVEPISSSDNSSSDCWPIVPKAYDLSFVSSFKTEGDYLTDTMSDEFFGITPILTLFIPGDSNEIVSKAEAQMTCMKTIDTTVASNSTKSSGSDDEDNAGESLALNGHMVLGFVFAASALLLM
ncbi:hypothetical protein EDB81DRAFT_769552 [Dactylonectria macrodidyma]|uniref:Uncharacterized protein n=1 Tax=Dactylonectria macrodidyma TaxID=307937 RepID=A0A9P9FTF2_9HYPO|nr:hypothetical protein EDB81DRAFT_769552 [Dactylonectria macrodidyma]